MQMLILTKTTIIHMNSFLQLHRAIHNLIILQLITNLCHFWENLAYSAQMTLVNYSTKVEECKNSFYSYSDSNSFKERNSLACVINRRISTIIQAYLRTGIRIHNHSLIHFNFHNVCFYVWCQDRCLMLSRLCCTSFMSTSHARYRQTPKSRLEHLL